MRDKKPHEKWKPQHSPREQARIWYDKSLLWEARHPRVTALLQRIMVGIIFTGFIFFVVGTLAGWIFLAKAIKAGIAATKFI